MSIKISTATLKDRKQLINYFSHYKIKELIEKRVDCYVIHHFTVIAKNDGEIVGVLQWHIKENPQAGVVEFEEIHVKKEYRNKGIGSKLIEYAIQAVKDHLDKFKIKPRKIFLFVSKNNKNAQEFYEKNGFKFASKAGNLFIDNEIELIYILDF